MARPESTKQIDAARACVAAGECRPPARSAKSTRVWCKGREGIPHAWLWEDDPGWARFRDRWAHQIRVCFGCGKHGHALRRTRCRTCGSPQRYFDDPAVRQWRGRTVRYHARVGPFCLCPDNFDARAEVGYMWVWFRGDEPIPWADDPDQIARLTSSARVAAAALRSPASAAHAPLVVPSSRSTRS